MMRALGAREAPAMEPLPEERSLWGETLRRLRRNRPAMLGLGVLLALAFVAIFAGPLSPHDPNSQDCATGAFKASSGQHLLGTDAACRDVLSRLLHGARVSFSVAFLTQLSVLAIAVPIGALAALSARWLDNLLMRFTDFTFAFPDLLLIILLRQILADTAIPGGSIVIVVLAISLVSWTTMARLVRAQLLALKQRDYVLAAEALGASRTHIFLQHLLPNSLGPLLVALTFGIPQAIFAEASLSFLGLGIMPPDASWGSMINSGYDAVHSHPALVVYPAVAIGVTMLAFTFLADGLRDALDPRSEMKTRGVTRAPLP